MVVDIAIQKLNLMRVNEFSLLPIGNFFKMGVAVCSLQTFVYTSNEMHIGEMSEGLYRIFARYRQV